MKNIPLRLFVFLAITSLISPVFSQEEGTFTPPHFRVVEASEWNSTSYPDPNQPASTILPGFFRMKRSGWEYQHLTTNTYAANSEFNKTNTTQTISQQVEGNIKRVLQSGNVSLVLTEELKDSMVIRQNYTVNGQTITYEHTYYYTDPHLYKITHHYGTKFGIPQRSYLTVEDITACLTNSPDKTNFTARDDAQAGYFQGLSDIAITDDGYVVGCNYIRAYHHNHYVGETLFGSGEWNTAKPSLYGSPDDVDPPKTAEGVQHTWDRPFFRVYMWKVPLEEMSKTTYPSLIMQERIIGELDPDWPKKGNVYPDKHVCWVTADFERADIGYTMDVMGNSNDFALTYSAVRTPYPQTFRRNDGTTFTETCYEDKVRFTTIQIKNGQSYPTADGRVYSWLMKPTQIYVTKTADNLHAEWSLDEVGKRYEIVSSPLNQKYWTFDGTKIGVRHFRQTQTQAYANGDVGDTNQPVGTSRGSVGLIEDYTYAQEGEVASEGHYGYAPYRNTYFRYGGRSLMVDPYTIRDTDGKIKIKGVRMYDITDGFDKMRLIPLVGDQAIELGTPRDVNEVQDVQVMENIDGANLSLYLFLGKHILTLTSVDMNQSRGTFAYDLRTTYDETTNKNAFTYKVNDMPYKAELIFYAQDASNKKVEVGRHTIYEAGDNTLQVDANGDIVGSYSLDCSKFITAGHSVPASAETLLWSIEVQDTTVYNWQLLDEYTAQSGGTTSHYSYNTIDKSPESPFFGRIYRVDHYNSSSKTSSNGVMIHNPRFETDNVLYRGGIAWGKPMRPAVDSTGLLYIPDVNTAVSNVYVMNPHDMTAKAFFSGTRDSKGYWTTSSGAFMGGTMTGLATRGSGANTELIAYSRNGGSTNAVDALFYKIGATDGKTAPTWSTAPTQKIVLVGQDESQQGNIIPTENSIFVAQVGDDSHNNTEIEISLTEYLNNGTLNYKSHLGGSTQLDEINRSPGGGAALTNDGKYLLFQNTFEGSSYLGNGRHSEFILYTLNNGSNDARLGVKYRYVYSFETVGNYTARSNAGVRQMNFDYAGNLVVSGADGWMAYYAVPTVGVSSQTPIVPDGDAAHAAYYNIHETPAQTVLDCPYCVDGYDRVFTGEKDANWGNVENWQPASLPAAHHRVRVDADCAVNTTTATAAYVDLLSDASLTIRPAQGLTVGGSGVNEAASGDVVKEGYIRRVPTGKQTNVLNPNQRSDREALQAGNLVIQSTADGQGSLAQRDKDSATLATVEIYGRYLYEDKDNTAYPLTWQYMGMPFHVTKALIPFANTWMYTWTEPISTWDNIMGPDKLETWKGYIMTGRLSDGHRVFTLQGNLEETNVTHEIPLSWKGATASYKGANYVANTWTAPLQIDKLTAADFVDADPTIYFYAPAYNKRQYVAVPIGQAASMGLETINALQGFFVLANGGNAKLRLDYETLVSKEEQLFWTDDVLNNKATTRSAPRRMGKADDETRREQQMMRIAITGSDGSTDEIVLFEHADYTLGFDATFEGRKLQGGEGTPYLTAVSTDGDMSVLATPSFAGTMVHFRKGEAKEYTLRFEYDGEELYLQDLHTHTCVAIRSGSTYHFTSTEEALHTRFRIVGQAMPEDIEPMAWGSEGKVYVENPSNVLMGVSVYTIDGKLVTQFATHDTLLALDVPHAGVYIVNLETETGSRAFKQIL